MRLPRPYIPIDVRLQVAVRLLGYDWSIKGQSKTERLGLMLRKLFGTEPYHLDHNPALENRDYDSIAQEYTPAANDPEYLIYRSVQAHKIKTYVRGDGAQHSDAGLRRKTKRLARNRQPQRKRNWPSRPFPQGRKFQQRGKR
jgi:hypothetical protein